MTAPTVTINSIANGGDGVATLPDGRTVFVPRTAPDDVVVLSQLDIRKRFARAQVGEVILAGPDRVEPGCPHYVRDRCGGCQLMHLSPTAQLAVKSHNVGDAVRRLAGIDISDPRITAAPAVFGYRNKVTLAFKHGRLGFHRLSEAGKIFELENCAIMTPELSRLHVVLKRHKSSLPKDTAGVVLRLDSEGHRHLIIKTSGQHGWPEPQRFGDLVGSDVIVWWHPSGGAPRVMAGGHTPWPATVFEQVNAVVATQVRQAAITKLINGLECHGKTAWDLYSGVGDASMMIAEHGCAVEAIERDPRAVQLARERAGGSINVLVGDVAERVRELATPMVVFTNPPRTGMANAVTEAIVDSSAVRVVYVSCDPATMSRDIARMTPEFTLTHLEAFDQFPQTAHVESLAVLERQ